MLSKTCTECKKPFNPFHKNQITCGKDECKRSRQNGIRKKEDREFNCKACGDLTWSSLKTAVLCGKISCRKTYQNRFNLNGEYKQRLFDKVKSKATVSGKYSEKEINTIIKMKLKGHTHTEIALTLKRVLPNVDAKVRAIFSDDRFVETIESIKYEVNTENRKANRKGIEYWNDRINQIFNKDK